MPAYAGLTEGSGQGKVLGCLFPVPAVEGARGDGKSRRIVERVQVDAPRPWMGARLVEALHSAEAAEEMVGGARAEAVAGQRLFAGEKPEIAVRDDQVPEPRHG